MRIQHRTLRFWCDEKQIYEYRCPLCPHYVRTFDPRTGEFKVQGKCEGIDHIGGVFGDAAIDAEVEHSIKIKQ